MPDPSALSAEAFRDALGRGSGRTMLALRSPDGRERYGGILVAGCLENLQFDRQCETGRAPFLFRLAAATGMAERVLMSVLDALPTSEDDWDRDQMIDLLGEYLAVDEERAWNALIRLAKEGNERAGNALAASGERGLMWAAEHVVPGFSEEDRWRVGMWLPDEEADDRTETQRRLRMVLRQDKARRSALPKPAPSPTLSPREFLERLGSMRMTWEATQDFVRHASAEEFLDAAERLLITDNRRTLSALSRVFRHVPFPLPLERLFALIDDEPRASRVSDLLGRIQHPLVREFALQRLRRQPPDWNGTEMLRASFIPGDEKAIGLLLSRLEDEDRDVQHGVVLGLVEMMFNLDRVDWQPFAEWMYEHSLCSFCRGSAVRWMSERGTIPPEVREEGVYDAEPDVRALCGAG